MPQGHNLVGLVKHYLGEKPVLDMDLDVSFGEDAAVSYGFKRLGKKWKKVESYLVYHYPKIEGYTIRRTGIILRVEQIFVPKNVQIKKGVLREGTI